MMFPMKLSSDMTTLTGTINGMLKSGASVIPGITGTGLFTGSSGGYLDLGKHLGGGCPHYPDHCSDGITIALWLKIYELPSSNSFAVAVHNGGCRKAATGYCIFIQHDGLGLQVRYELSGSFTKIAGLPLHQWYHITISNMNDTHTSIYVNGCPANVINNVRWERTTPITSTWRLTFGSIDRSRNPAHVALDQIAIWYTALLSDDIWHFYVNEATRWFALIERFSHIGMDALLHYNEITIKNDVIIFLYSIEVYYLTLHYVFEVRLGISKYNCIIFSLCIAVLFNKLFKPFPWFPWFILRI